MIADASTAKMPALALLIVNVHDAFPVPASTATLALQVVEVVAPEGATDGVMATLETVTPAGSIGVAVIVKTCWWLTSFVAVWTMATEASTHFFVIVLLERVIVTAGDVDVV